MADNVMAWVVLFFLVALGFCRLINKAIDEWDYRNYDEYHFNGHESDYWRGEW